MSTAGPRPPFIPPVPISVQVDRLIAQAQAALNANELERAGRTAEAATRLDPKRREPWLILCSSLARIGSADAEKAMAYAIGIFPENDPFRTILEADRSQALGERGRMDEAVAQARIAASRSELTPASRRVVAATFLEAGLFEEALPHAEAAYAAQPGDANINFNLGTVLRFLGRLKDAEAAYRRALAAEPDESLTYIRAALSSLRKWTDDDNNIEALRALVQATPANTEAAARLHYALFKELDDLKRGPEAWTELSAGADIARRILPFDVAEKTAVTDTLITVFPRERFANIAPRPTLPGPQPIFIFGLPRSGTTLVERIFSAHSRVTAMGETTGLGRAVKAVARTPGPLQMDAWTLKMASGANGDDIARLYQKYTAHLSQGADLVTEKLPHNYHYVGHMRLAFPKAPLVHVLRSPMDSLFGAYRLLFGEGAYGWSYSQPDLAANYRQYRRLMDHWRSVLGDDFIEIRLETLIDDPEGEIPRLLDRAGLTFEEACMSPESAPGGVSTASSAQVRQPINRQGVGAWRRYAEQLEPLRAELERDGFVDKNGEAIW